MKNPQITLSVPPALTDCFSAISGKGTDEVFVTNDPPGAKLGSGGGTAHLLNEAFASSGEKDFKQWLSSASRVMLHAGGQSRRLPAYAASGKSLIPVPVFTGGVRGSAWIRR